MRRRFILDDLNLTVIVTYPEKGTLHRLQVLVGEHSLLNLKAGPSPQREHAAVPGKPRASVRVEQYSSGAKILFSMEVALGNGSYARLECRDDTAKPLEHCYGFRLLPCEPADEALEEAAVETHLAE